MTLLPAPLECFSPETEQGQHLLNEQQAIGGIVDVGEAQHPVNVDAPAVLEEMGAAHQLLGNELAQAHAKKLIRVLLVFAAIFLHDGNTKCK